MSSSSIPLENAAPARPAHRIIPGRSRRGFAAMDPAKQLEIARKGGAATHKTGRGHRFTSEEARAAGQKGGSISRRGPNKSKSQA